MRLSLTRAQRSTWHFYRQYLLTARLECDSREHAIIIRHQLTLTRVYTSPQARALDARARAAVERAAKLSSWRTNEWHQRAWHELRAFALGIRADFAFSISVHHLLAGIIIRCRHLPEMLEAEAALITGLDVLQSSLANAIAFDAGREQLLEPDAPDREPLAAPATWARFHRR